MKKLVILLCWLLLLTGCATYNAMNDPVYQAYLRGEISYADYVAHYDRMMATRQAQAQAIAQAFQQGYNQPPASSPSPPPNIYFQPVSLPTPMSMPKRYHARPDYIGGYYIDEQ